jgi:hypothetical protein
MRIQVRAKNCNNVAVKWQLWRKHAAFNFNANTLIDVCACFAGFVGIRP